MLNLTRRVGEQVLFGNLITIELKEIRGSYITLSIEAPKSIRVLRAELSGAEEMGYQGGDVPFLGNKLPIETAPRDGTYILLFGDSGYTTTPHRCHVAKWDAEYRPKDPWRTFDGGSFQDDGGPPTHWMPLPQ